MTYNQSVQLFYEQTNFGDAYNAYDAGVENFYLILGEFVVTGLAAVCLVAVCIWLLWQALVYATFVVIAIHGSLSAFGEWLCSLKQRYGLLLTLIVCGLVPVVLFFIFNWYQSRTFLELLGIVAVGSQLTIFILDEHQSTKIKR